MVSIGIVLIVLASRRKTRERSVQSPDIAPGHALTGSPGSDRSHKTAQALKVLETACRKNDRVTAYAACITWLNLVYGDNAKASNSHAGLSPLMVQELAGMEKALYAGEDPAPWSGKSLLRRIAEVAHALPARKSRRSSGAILPPLYPVLSVDQALSHYRRGSDML